MSEPWRDDLLDQLDFYWSAHLRPRLEGLEDAEFWWEPASGAWSLRRDDDGVLRLEQLSPEPPVPPLTTIAWRTVHVARDVMGARARAIFGPSPAPPGTDMFDARHWPDPLPATSAEGIALLEAGFQAWRDGVAGLTDARLREPIGPVGGQFGNDPMSRLVLHINREVMAHGAEICLLRDLFRARRDREDPLVAAALAGDAAQVANLLAVPGAAKRLAEARPQLLEEIVGLRHVDAVRALVAGGVLPRAGGTELHRAAAAGEGAVVDLLLAHGANPLARDPQFD